MRHRVRNQAQHDFLKYRGYKGQMLSGDSLTNIELDTLRAIAQLCPYTDGNAVYLARAILFDFDTTEYQSICEGEEPNSLRVTNPNLQGDSILAFQLYPNPNDGEFTVEYSLKETQSGEMIIFSVTGQFIKTVPLVPGTQILPVNLDFLSTGTYFYQVNVDGEIKLTDRIVIID